VGCPLAEPAGRTAGPGHPTPASLRRLHMWHKKASEMHIAALSVELEITDGITLKDKRQVIKSLLDRIRNRFNVSAAEVDRLDSPRFATLAAVGVANERPFVDEMMAKVANLIESEPRVLVLQRDLEFL